VKERREKDIHQKTKEEIKNIARNKISKETLSKEKPSLNCNLVEFLSKTQCNKAFQDPKNQEWRKFSKKKHTPG